MKAAIKSLENEVKNVECTNKSIIFLKRRLSLFYGTNFYDFSVISLQGISINHKIWLDNRLPELISEVFKVETFNGFSVQFVEMNLLIICFFLLLALASVNFSEGRRIVGGNKIEIKRAPYQVSLQIKIGARVYHICGGSLISDRFVISAAHCELLVQKITR